MELFQDTAIGEGELIWQCVLKNGGLQIKQTDRE